MGGVYGDSSALPAGEVGGEIAAERIAATFRAYREGVSFREVRQQREIVRRVVWPWQLLAALPEVAEKIEAVNHAVFHDFAERELFLRGGFLVPSSTLIALGDDLRRRWNMIPGGEYRDVVLLFLRAGDL